MGVVSSSFKSTVTFGGVVSSSFKSSSATLARNIKGAESEVAKLTRQQEKLTQKIKEGVLAGKDVSKLKEEYTDLSRSIEEANKDAQKLNKTLMARKAWATPLAALSRHSGLTGAVGGIGGRLSNLRGQGVIPTVLPSVGIAAGLGGGLVGGMLAVNSATAEQSGIAKSYGVDLTTFKAWEGIGKKIGLDGEAMGDLAEELANKIGEFKTLGEMSSVSDAFTGLGLTMQDLEGKTNEQQMELILDRASKLKDQQVARSMVDMIMGGEGNKILTFMKASGDSYREMIDAQKKYILVTKEGEEGAVRGQMAVSDLWTAVGSATQEVVGVLMGDLAPSIQKFADDFVKWFQTGGKEELLTGIRSFATSISEFWSNKLQPVLMSLWKGLQALARLIEKVVPDKFFQDYETAFNKSNNLAEVKLVAMEEWKRLNPENTSSLFNPWSDESIEYRAFVNAEIERKRLQIESSKAIPLAESNSPLAINERFRNATRDDLPASGNAKPPLQQNSLQITVITQPGDDAHQIGSAVADATFSALPLLGGNSIMTPATLGG